MLYQQWIEQGRIDNWVGGIPVPGWNLHNRLTLLLHAERQIDRTFAILNDLVNQLVPEHSDQLLQFQRATILEYDRLPTLPLQLRFDWDFWGHLVEGTDLNQTAYYEFSTQEDVTMSATMFLENFWFGRKRNFGKTRIKRLSKQ